jgi:hypothetical protein
MNFNGMTGLHELRLIFLDKKNCEDLQKLHEEKNIDIKEIVPRIYEEELPESPLAGFDPAEILFVPQIINHEILKIFKNIFESNH